MMSSIVPTCFLFTNPTAINGDESQIIGSITRTTSPQEFDAICEKYPNYHLQLGDDKGSNALCKASQKGNTALLKHIVEKGGKELLERGNSEGATPLFIAVFYRQLGSLITLIDLGANVNVCIAELPIGRSPLYVAMPDFNKGLAHRAAITKLLLRNSAIAQPSPDVTGFSLLKAARKQLRDEKKIFHEQFNLATDNKIASVIVDIIEGYAACAPLKEYFDEEEDYKKAVEAEKKAAEDAKKNVPVRIPLSRWEEFKFFLTVVTYVAAAIFCVGLVAIGGMKLTNYTFTYIKNKLPNKA